MPCFGSFQGQRAVTPGRAVGFRGGGAAAAPPQADAAAASSVEIHEATHTPSHPFFPPPFSPFSLQILQTPRPVNERTLRYGFQPEPATRLFPCKRGKHRSSLNRVYPDQVPDTRDPARFTVPLCAAVIYGVVPRRTGCAGPVNP